LFLDFVEPKKATATPIKRPKKAKVAVVVVVAFVCCCCCCLLALLLFSLLTGAHHVESEAASASATGAVACMHFILWRHAQATTATCNAHQVASNSNNSNNSYKSYKQPFVPYSQICLGHFDTHPAAHNPLHTALLSAPIAPSAATSSVIKAAAFNFNAHLRLQNFAVCCCRCWRCCCWCCVKGSLFPQA